MKPEEKLINILKLNLSNYGFHGDLVYQELKDAIVKEFPQIIKKPVVLSHPLVTPITENMDTEPLELCVNLLFGNQKVMDEWLDNHFVEVVK